MGAVKIAIGLAIVVAIGAIAYGIISGGSEDSEYTPINNVEEFMSMEAGGSYILKTDIDMTGIAGDVPMFKKLNGDGHTVSGFTKPLFGDSKSPQIKNITFDGNVEGEGCGLLFTNSDATLTNIVLKGTLTTSGDGKCGSIASTFGGKITDSKIDVNISGDAPAGGFAGISSGTIKNSTFDGIVSSTKHASGIVCESSGLTIEGCTVSGEITSDGSASGIAFNYIKEDKRGPMGDYLGSTYNIDAENIVLKNLTICGDAYVGGGYSKCKGGGYAPVSVENTFVKGRQYVGGLYGYAEDGTITARENMTMGLTVYGLDDSTYENIYLGGVVGYAEGVDMAYYCDNYSRVINESTGKCTGGIAGALSNSHLIQCKNYGEVTSYGDNTGGIAGYAYVSFSGNKIEKCENHMNVEGGNNVGGVLGFSDPSWAVGMVEVKNCVNKGTISGSSNVSQIAGNEDKARILNCTSEGAVA